MMEYNWNIMGFLQGWLFGEISWDVTGIRIKNGISWDLTTIRYPKFQWFIVMDSASPKQSLIATGRIDQFLVT
jgi:hypothetical protein